MENLPAFRNEPYTDFSAPSNRQAMEEALRSVHAQFGREYQLRIGGEWIATGDKLNSLNPSNTREVVGIHHKATAALAQRAVESAYAQMDDGVDGRPARAGPVAGAYRLGDAAHPRLDRADRRHHVDARDHHRAILIEAQRPVQRSFIGSGK